MNKLEYLAGINTADTTDYEKYNCKYKKDCNGRKYHMRCDFQNTREKCRIFKFYEKYGNSYNKLNSDGSFSPHTFQNKKGLISISE